MAIILTLRILFHVPPYMSFFEYLTLGFLLLISPSRSYAHNHYSSSSRRSMGKFRTWPSIPAFFSTSTRKTMSHESLQYSTRIANDPLSYSRCRRRFLLGRGNSSTGNLGKETLHWSSFLFQSLQHILKT